MDTTYARPDRAKAHDAPDTLAATIQRHLTPVPVSNQPASRRSFSTEVATAITTHEVDRRVNNSRTADSRDATLLDVVKAVVRRLR